MDIKKIALFGLGTFGLLFAGLYIKNSIDEKSMKPLSKADVIRILKVIRKGRYLLCKQIATFAVNIKQQTRSNITQEIIEQFINGPECPFNYEEDLKKINSDVCTQNNTTVEIFTFTLDKLGKQPEIIHLLEQQMQDYKTSLGGRLPHFDVAVPSTLTREKIYMLQNRITKAAYMHQVRIFKKMREHTEIELQQNPQLLKDLGNPDVANEQMLREEGLETEYEPASAVYEAAIMQFRNQPDFINKIQQLEVGYQKILMKYGPKLQAKTITNEEFSMMEDEIVYHQPI